MELIVEAACGAVSHTYTTQIGENRQDVCVCSGYASSHERVSWMERLYVCGARNLLPIPLFVHFGPFYSLYLGQVIPA